MVQKRVPSAMLVAAGLALAGSDLAAQERLVVVVASEPQSLDPCDTDIATNSRVLRNNVTETLTRLDPDSGEVLPSLATDWRQIDDRTWEFTLREGVKFHDGTGFDAEAVATALARGTDPDLRCGVSIAALNEMTVETTVISPSVIRISSNAPEPILPNKLSAVDIGAPSMPMDQKTREPIGTGPYRFAGWETGQRIELEAFDDYWGDIDVIPEVTYEWRSESSVRAAMVAAGEAHIAFELAPQDATTDMDVSFPNAETSLLRIDQTIPPLDDVRVREAINLAIDRDQMIGTIFDADVQKAMQVVLPSVFGYNPDIQQWPFDPDRARALLAEAEADGVDISTPIALFGRIDLYPNSGESLEVIQAMLMDVGLTVDLKMMETGPWLDYLVKPYDPNRPPNLLQTQIDNTQGDAVFTLAPRFSSDGVVSTIQDPELDALIEKAGLATGEERRQLFQKAFSYLAVDAINIVPLFHMVASARIAPNVDYTPDVQAGNELKLRDISFE